MMKYYLTIIFITIFTFSKAQQNPKTVKALKIDKSPIIDGILNEAFWNNAEPAKDFVMFNPGDGEAERSDKKTIVKIAYNNEAIYIGATLYDNKPNEIPMQFSTRDNFGITDFFVVTINPENDGQNDTEFIVMSTGNQADAKLSLNGEDFSWNAVWKSAVKLNKDNWTVEIKIPYSELRFNNTKSKTWGINFSRKFNKLDEQYVWNYVDKKVGSFTQYSGKLTGIENITPPTRLSFSPYASSNYSSFDGTHSFDNNIGMDLKYGINESFTLDATLIPDFGQTAFDDLVLNLGPFEQQYQEQRSFFTEGTELFSKGGLFYSRRIGNTPTNFYAVEANLGSNEEIIDNPSKVNMLNAIKVSGRTSKGLGIGFFNAITEKTFAKIKNIITNKIRNETTEPLANYNVLVLDQQFNKNSSVSFVNTSVIRNGDFRDANVSALLFNLADKKSKYNLSGAYKLSNVYENSDKTTGYAGYLKFEKTYGNFQYEIAHSRSNDTYDINDLGFQRNNNYANYSGGISYRIFKPTKHFNQYRVSLNGDLNYQNKPNNYQSSSINLDAFFITKSRFAFGANIMKNIGSQYDFYEPRVTGRFFKQNAVFFSMGWISTDYRKKFAMDLRAGYGIRHKNNNLYRTITFSPRYRFSDKFQLIYRINYSNMTEEKGWVNELDNGAIIFGNRNIRTLTNTLISSYNFNIKNALNLSFRYYWSPVKYADNYYELNNNGTLEASNYTAVHDINYNIWNLDLSYNWEFAPGSQLIVLYRNSIFNSDEMADLSFSQNLNNLFKQPKTNIFSIKLIYYLDYNNVKRWL
ncbi:MAG: carbohydrate binding family 9 domain-containing protein [Lutibacter sp.]|nr:carbohydrate binding family 9 domain-containing protein [Lutibacter sp.]